MNKIEQAKILIKDKTIDDNLLSFYFDLIERKVKNFCHREDIPDGLRLIIIEMVASYVNLKHTESSISNSSESVQSVKRGDTQITYGSALKLDTSELSIQDFILSYKPQLYNYRKLVSR